MTPERLYAALHRGRDGAQSLSALAEALDVPRRTLEKAVQELRSRGYPVASGREGVWVADSHVDLAQTYQQLRHRIVEQSRTAWAVRTSMRRLRAAEDRGEVEQLWLDLGDAA